MPAYWLDHNGTRYPLNRRETVIGRSEDCAVYLPNSQVSRIHAVVRWRDDDNLELVDLGSMNGTRLNGERMLGPHKIHHGDIIRIGSDTLVVHVDEAASAPELGAGPGAVTTSRPLDGERGVADSIDLAEALLNGGESADRRDAAARTVRSLVDQVLARMARERLNLDGDLAGRVATLVERLGKLSPATATPDWLDEVAEHVRSLLERK